MLRNYVQTNFQVIAETRVMLKNKNPSTITFDNYIEHADKWSASRWNSLYETINTGITEVTANSAQATLYSVNIFIQINL